MLPLLTKGLGSSPKMIAAGFGSSESTTDTIVRRIGSSRKTSINNDKISRKYEVGKRAYEVYTVGAALTMVNNSMLTMSKIVTKTKAVYPEDVKIKVTDIRKSSSIPFYKIFIERVSLKMRRK
jgi:hypothetical protein